eukprot:scaffold21498_cov221-Amphora_coffeaeformis.AAC.1
MSWSSGSLAYPEAHLDGVGRQGRRTQETTFSEGAPESLKRLVKWVSTRAEAKAVAVKPGREMRKR